MSMLRKRLSSGGLLLTTAALLLAASGSARGGAWPMYRADAGRGGYTSEKLPARLALQWVYKPAHPPVPAWPDEPRMPSRITFDRANHVVSDGKSIYFGSSADCKIYALDAASGRERWTFFTGGPVRFAPALWKDKLFAVSDDGYLYCLAAKDGKLLWKKRGGPSGRMVLGNERMISKWPARGGPVVVGDVVYFGAGIWPNDGVYIYALNAASGEVIWINDKSGSLKTPQPHRGGTTTSGYSCQGYLAVAGDKLFVPAGRSVPAAFNRADGKLLYYHLAKYGDANGGATGGSPTAAVDSYLFNGNSVFAAADGKRIKSLGRVFTGSLVAGPKRIFGAYHGHCMFRIGAFDRARPLLEKEVVDKRSKTKAKKKVKYRNNVWKWDARVKQRKPKHGPATLIVAGGTAIFGALGEVHAVDIASRKTLWSGQVAGTVLGLAVAGGRVFASTEQGAIYCFGPGAARGTVIEKKPSAKLSSGKSNYAAAAEEILKKTGLKAGYCLDLGCGEGELAIELARRTDLRIYGIEKDPAKVAAARRKLSAAGLYGLRVTILQGDPANSELPNYFANLVVSGNSVAGAALSGKEALRCARPYGGVIYSGKPGAMRKSVRGPLKGAGSWTHQYANAANTACSDDERVKGRLTMLWFGGPHQLVADRHARAPAPLFANGRMYVQGLKAIRATDAYNGRVLWELPFKSITKQFAEMRGGGGRGVMAGVSVTGNIMCAAGDVLYAQAGNSCLRIDGATGKTLAEFKAPAGDAGVISIWGFLACDGKTLFGSLADDKFRIVKRKVLGESRTFFALDAVTGKLKWRYDAKHSIRHNAIAIGGGCVYLIDRKPAPGDRLTFKKPPKGTPWPKHPTGTLLALDAASGKVKWQRTENIYGTMLALSTEHDTLLMGYQPAGYGLASEGGSRLGAFTASSGKPLYDVKAKYGGHPVIIGRTIHAQSRHWARSGGWDLLTGKRLKGRTRGGGSCGIMAGGRHILTFRAGGLGYVDPLRAKGVSYYGGARPGCWINAIPAGGLVLIPEFSQGCRCSYQIKTTLALEPAK
jgi:outer membrane protein assembly factor BamB